MENKWREIRQARCPEWVFGINSEKCTTLVYLSASPLYLFILYYYYLFRTCVHCKPRNHGRATRQRMSLRAATHSGSAFTHRYRTDSELSLAPRRRTRLQPINIHGRPLAEGRMGLCIGQKRAWGGREYGAEGSMGRFQGRLGRKGASGGREPGAEGSTGRKGGWGGRD
jgi:hypothetical protein